MPTSEYELQQRIQELEAELAASRAELQEFTYTVSHDLRAPLRHLVSFARLLEEEAGTQLNGENADFLRTITASADRMGLMLDALTALSRLGGVQAVLEPLALAPLVNECVLQAKSAFVDRPVVVKLHVHDSLEVVADAAVVRQVLAQVLGNAYKFTSKVAEPVIAVIARETPDGGDRASGGGQRCRFQPGDARQVVQGVWPIAFRQAVSRFGCGPTDGSTPAGQSRRDHQPCAQRAGRRAGMSVFLAGKKIARRCRAGAGCGYGLWAVVRITTS